MCVKETSPCDVSFTHTQHNVMFDREKTLVFISFGLIIYYYSNVRCFRIKSLVRRTSNLPDSIVLCAMLYPRAVFFKSKTGRHILHSMHR